MYEVQTSLSAILPHKAGYFLLISFIVFFSCANQISSYYLKLATTGSFHILSIHSLLFIIPLYAIGLHFGTKQRR